MNMKKYYAVHILLGALLSARSVLSSMAIAADGMPAYPADVPGHAEGRVFWTIPPVSRQWDRPSSTQHWTIPSVSQRWNNPQAPLRWTIPRTADDMK